MSCLEQLTRLGLNGRQANVYIALLQLGTASAIEIAKATRYKHPTVYDVLDVLKERRLVAESFSGGRKLFTAEDPENLLEEENRRRQALDAVLPDLKALYDQQAHRPRVRFYQGEEAYRAINRQLLNVKSGEYFYFGSVQEMFQFCTPRDHEEYVKERVRRGIRSYAIGSAPARWTGTTCAPENRICGRSATCPAISLRTWLRFICSTTPSR